MRYLAAVAAIALLGVQANAATFDTFTESKATAILSAAGGANVKTEVIEGTTFISFDMDGLTYSSSLRLCDKDKTKGCLGLLLAVAFEADGTDSLEVINRFNTGAPFETAVKVDEKTIAFGRFVLASGGIEPANVAANLAVLKAAPSIYFELKKSQIVASNGPGGSTTMLSQNARQIGPLRPVRLNQAQLRILMNDAMATGIKLH
ncbi:MAG: hypothetical protein ABL973_01615 [Micropepsaceae bacterium]